MDGWMDGWMDEWMDENENRNIEKGCRDVDNCVHETGIHLSGV